MTYKHTMTVSKPWFQSASPSFSPAGLFARLKNAIKLEIPVAYQDETGFHNGVKTDEQEIKWPATW
jgi:hypothetical protein